MKQYYSKLIAVILGAAIWIFSPMATGHYEPWDARGPYYWAMLLMSGVVVGWVAPRKFLTTSLWVVAGQALVIFYGIIFGGKDMGLLIPMGAIMLLVLSAPCYLGAYLGSMLAVRNKD